MLEKIINRPVLATVISTLLVILGLLGLSKLPLQQFPDIAPPSVKVTANYPGANAETVLRSVAPSLEESINGVENMTYMSSTASNDGSLAITVYFKLGTNPDQAQVNVQNRVAQATSQLPSEVVQQGVVTIKQQNSLIMVVGMYTDDEKKYDEAFVANYAQINIIPEMKRIQGVGSAAIFGGTKDYSMRVWLNPSKMDTYHLTPADVNTAIQDNSLESAPGRFGESSKQDFEYIIKYKGKLTKPEEYQDIAIRTNNDGSVLRLKDVARVEFGSYSYSSFARLDGKKGIGVAVIQLAGSNSNEIQVAINRLMIKDAKKFPVGIKYNTFYSTKTALDESINQVEHTLFEAFILVFLVVFIFLQDFRSTLIPAIAVPVAIIGTFFFMQLFGFTINLLTLFALVLAIGIVVDDAIVVVEAVHAKMEHEGLNAAEATKAAMKEITGAIISITLVMAAVFLPVGFLEGSTGVFFRQFAFTLAIAIMISALNALTLSPALTALFLKNPHLAKLLNQQPKSTFKTRFFSGFNKGFSALTNLYEKGLKFLITYRWLSMAMLGVITLATVWMVEKTATGFIPTEDQGFVAVAVSTPSGSSLERTSEVIKEAEDRLRKVEAGRQVTTITGYNLLTSSSSSSSAVIFFQLKPNKDRGKVKDIKDVIAEISGSLGEIKGGTFFPFTFPTVPGFSNVEAIDVQLQDQTNGDLNKFSGLTNSFIGDLMKQKEIGFAFTTFKSDFPQYQLVINSDKANQLGVVVKDILQTMQAYFGTAQASDFNRFGKYYKVVVQADISDRAEPSSLDRVFVKNKLGEMVPINTLVKLTRVYGPETASRYNLFNSIEINVIPKPGFSSGQAIEAIGRLAKEKLPDGYTYEFTGQTREEISSGGQSAIIFALSLIFVYFLLAAQYESYILPFAIIFSIPTGIFGVFVAIGLKGIDNNIYVQVALVMLIGLLAKNAILIVEFAIQRRRAGMALMESAIGAAKLRIRPIIMTSLAFVFGLFPMSITTGPSAQGNHSISYAAAGGMISAVFLGVLFIPVLFVIFQGLQERISSRISKKEIIQDKNKTNPNLNLN
jgi:HAE1 family hydrophobic/amphiphilic exporter-1